MASLWFYMKRIISSVNIESFTFSFAIWIPFISFSFLISGAGTSKMMLNNSDESGHPCLVPDFRGNAFNFSPLRIVCYVFFIYSFYFVEVCSFYSCFLEGFYHKWMLNFVKSSAPVGMIIWFLFFNLLIGVSCWLICCGYWQILASLR